MLSYTTFNQINSEDVCSIAFANISHSIIKKITRTKLCQATIDCVIHGTVNLHDALLFQIM